MSHVLKPVYILWALSTRTCINQPWQPAGLLALSCRPTWKLHQPKQLQFQDRERSWNQRRWITNWTSNEEIRTRKKFQAVDKTCIINPRLYSRTFARSHTHRGSEGLPVCWSQKVVAGSLLPLALSPSAIPWHDALLLGTILHSGRHSYISTPTYQCLYSSTPTYQCLYRSTPTYLCLYSSTPTYQCLYRSTPTYQCLYRSTPTYQSLYRSTPTYQCLNRSTPTY